VPSNNYIYKMSNAGGMSTVTRYTDMLAGNAVWNPWEPQGAYDALSTVTVPSGGAASVTFAGIPNNYKHLQIRCLTKSSLAGPSSAIGVQFNSVTTGYFNHGIYGDGASAAAYATTSSNNAGSLFIAGSSTTNMFGAGIIDVLDYASSDKNKTIRILSGADFNGSGQVRFASGSFASTSPITSFTLLDVNGGTLSQFSQFALYGVR
jgi:hypothetical protein